MCPNAATSPFDDHHHVVGEPAQLVGVVAHPDHRQPVVGQLAGQRPRSPAGRRDRARPSARRPAAPTGRSATPGHTHPLRLTARQRVGLTVEQVGAQTDVFEHVARPDRRRRQRGRRGGCRAPCRGTAVAAGRPWPPAAAAPCGGQSIRSAARATATRPGQRIVEPIEQAQQRRLAGAGRPDDHGDAVAGMIDGDPPAGSVHPTGPADSHAARSRTRQVDGRGRPSRPHSPRRSAHGTANVPPAPRPVHDRRTTLPRRRAGRGMLRAMAWLVSDAHVLASADVADTRSARRRGLLGRTKLEGALRHRPVPVPSTRSG